MTVSLSPEQARKLVLHSQRLPGKANKSAYKASLEALENLSYVQIDTISVVQRAHHHCLWSRNPYYKLDHLDRLVCDGHAFEYWSHAAAYLPMRDYRHSLPRKAAIASGAMEHWYPREPKHMREVMARITAEGPLRARDFEQDNSAKKPGEWHHKPAKRALTYLFMQGDLMCCRHEGFQMVYDLRERVLPEGVDTSMPTVREHTEHLIRNYLGANGIAESKDICHLRKGIKKDVEQQLLQLRESGEVVDVSVQGKAYLALDSQLSLLERRLTQNRVSILSPFDNLLIQRHRMRELFNFDYQIECYTPEAKRKFGYFSLPLLWKSHLVGRLDCKADRKTKVLSVKSLHTEQSLQLTELFIHALWSALSAFQRFNNCDTLDLAPLSDGDIKRALFNCQQEALQSSQ